MWARYSTLIGDINQDIKDWHEKNSPERINADEFWQKARDIQAVNEKTKELRNKHRKTNND